MRYFTKSKFKLALECPTSLYYAGKKGYLDKAVDDPFLQALAEGGYQVGELAKYLFCEDPFGENITISTLNPEEALAETTARRQRKGKKVMAEAAFAFENFMVRVDLLVEEKNTIRLYEVKAKSWDESVTFLSAGIGKNAVTKLNREWESYLYDVTFQQWVVENATGKKVIPYLILADKTSTAEINGLNQLFRISKVEGRVTVKAREGLNKRYLGKIPLKVLNVQEECDWIYNNPVNIDLEGEWSFTDLLYFLSDRFINDKRIWSTPGPKCKSCSFINDGSAAGLKSGFHECWKHHTKLTEIDLNQPLVLELWCGGCGSKSYLKEAIAARYFLLRQVPESLYASNKRKVLFGDELDYTKRRTIQILKSSRRDYSPYVNVEGLKNLFDQFEPPYHFIDFETSMVALPFHKNRRPYEAIAFQYSYHLMDEKGNINHINDWLSMEPGSFPNYDFLRSLRNDLSGKKGTIFRYHSHENTYLNLLYNQLMDEPFGSVRDRDALLDFIREIAHPSAERKNEWYPKNDMQDLYRIVLDHFYSLYAKGSNSIKYILPAVIRSSDMLKEKYGKPVYGTPFMRSRNFVEPHVWISAEKQYNPYHTLPPVFSDMKDFNTGYNERDDELKDGGAAMMAYAALQFTDMENNERECLRKALLRYCELDTMAMVMIWEYFKDVVDKN